METAYPARLVQQREARAAHIRAWRDSGLTQKQYCGANGLNPTTFREALNN